MHVWRELLAVKNTKIVIQLTGELIAKTTIEAEQNGEADKSCDELNRRHSGIAERVTKKLRHPQTTDGQLQR